MPTGWPGGGVQGLFISRHFQRLGGGGRILISCWEGQTIELVGQLPHTLPPPFHTVDSHVLFKKGLRGFLCGGVKEEDVSDADADGNNCGDKTRNSNFPPAGDGGLT